MSNIDINSEIRTQQQITDSGNPRKPTGDDGQKMLERMNESHYAVTGWALEHWNINESDIILDIGCGGGIYSAAWANLGAAEVIGIRPMYSKLSAFAVSSFFVGVAGALWGFVHLGAWEPAAFSIDRSFQLLFMIIIGGLGSVMGSIFGAAFFILLPLFLNQVPHWLGLPISTATATYLEHMVFGALIVFFLIVEPHGLARLWQIAKEKLRLWPFPH